MQACSIVRRRTNVNIHLLRRVYSYWQCLSIVKILEKKTQYIIIEVIKMIRREKGRTTLVEVYTVRFYIHVRYGMWNHLQSCFIYRAVIKYTFTGCGRRYSAVYMYRMTLVLHCVAST